MQIDKRDSSEWDLNSALLVPLPWRLSAIRIFFPLQEAVES